MQIKEIKHKIYELLKYRSKEVYNTIFTKDEK